MTPVGDQFPGWVAAIEDTNPWFEVHLNNIFILKAIVTQGCQNVDYWTEEYIIRYWADGDFKYYLDSDTNDVKVSDLIICVLQLSYLQRAHSRSSINHLLPVINVVGNNALPRQKDQLT